ncbi:MAG: aryl-sulfate sulfotransferase [Alphaproteobacteria bacterium]|nr:aryl-sulfate sulfotransferase [Alphaproteobacteria bacterium]
MPGIQKHSVVLDGHKTSVSLEPEFWQALAAIAAEEGRSLNALIADIDKGRSGNLSSALRLYVLNHFEQRLKTPR